MMQMIIASRLTDGRVVFLDDRGGWAGDIAGGLVLDSGEAARQRLSVARRAVEDNMVVDPYLIDVSVENGRRRPVLVRERIRAFGPSPGPLPSGRRSATPSRERRASIAAGR